MFLVGEASSLDPASGGAWISVGMNDIYPKRAGAVFSAAADGAIVRHYPGTQRQKAQRPNTKHYTPNTKIPKPQYPISDRKTTMSIRLLAKELYQLRQEVERLERALASAAAGQREKIEAKLREARAERDHLRALLDGRKDSPGKAGRQTRS